MRLNTLKPPFLSMSHPEQLALIEAIQEDRLVDKRGIQEAKKLIAEFQGLSDEEKAHALSRTNGR